MRRFIPACAGNSAKVDYPDPLGAGSSPRVRGTRRDGCRGSVGVRFIPACAGNSLGRGERGRQSPVHPRVCGELQRLSGVVQERRRFIPACAGNSVVLRKRKAFVNGSSPRVRGTRRGRLASARQRRFIPACAGNSRFGRRAPPRPPVHPRVCGELNSRLVAALASTGSSPRVRGTHRAGRHRVREHRFIPACAGNSTALTRLLTPRVRFIPACAGNSLPRMTTTNDTPVHPRVCGELHGLVGRTPEFDRFIPACAGNSLRRATESARKDGSSPRVRGTQRGAGLVDVFGRFIPACAGNSAIGPSQRPP